MTFKINLIAVLILLLLSMFSVGMCQTEQKCNHCNNMPMSGLMYSHKVEKNKLMISSIYKFNKLADLKDGNMTLNNDKALDTYYAIPRSSTMNMYMLMLMYGITDKISVMAMIDYHHMNMKFQKHTSVNENYLYNNDGARTQHGGSSHTVSNESMNNENIYSMNHSMFSELNFNFNYKFVDHCNHHISGFVGIGLPIDNHHKMVNYSFNSGSTNKYWNIGLVSSFTKSRFVVGNQTIMKKSIGVNHSGFTKGVNLESNIWIGFKISNTFNINNRIQIEHQSRLEKSVEKWNTSTETTKDPINIGGSIISNYTGFVISGDKIKLPKLSISIEAGLPIYQNLNGWQLAQKINFISGINYHL